jgi:hypothetical protein
MSLVLQSSSGGQITIQEPATASNFTQTLPAVNGTIITTGNRPAGSVLQMVNATFASQTGTTSTSYVTSGLTASITPTSSSSKILAMCSFNPVNSGANLSSYYTLYRGGSNLFNSEGSFRLETSGSILTSGSIIYVDSPSTTSSTTYAVYMKSQTTGHTTYMAYGNATCSIVLLEIAG